jgi:hypothetical protein
VNPGDQLIIHFENDLPAVSSASTSDNMAGMKMTLSAEATPTTSTSGACNGAMSAASTNIHFHGTNVAPVCGQDEVVGRPPPLFFEKPASLRSSTSPHPA